MNPHCGINVLQKWAPCLFWEETDKGTKLKIRQKMRHSFIVSSLLVSRNLMATLSCAFKEHGDHVVLGLEPLLVCGLSQLPGDDI